MKIENIKDKLSKATILYSEDPILNKPSVIGYEKKFRWGWMATQLNTFIVATDIGSEPITSELIEKHLTESFNYTKQHYTGWPRGFQSGLGVIAILISSNIDEPSKTYCRELKSGKKWAGFSIPVVINSETNEVFAFERNPVWGAIYYPHFKQLINNLV